MHTLCERITESFAHVTEGAGRMAIGQRRYLWLARESPLRRLLLDMLAVAPGLLEGIRSVIVAALAFAALRSGAAPC